MIKQFLFSTVLTAAVAVSNFAVAAETTQVKQHTKTTHKKPAHHAKKHLDDAYKPSAHHAKNAEEVVVFAGAKIEVTSANEKKDALVNSEGLSVKVGGKVDIQYGVVNQKDAFKNPANNDNLPQTQELTFADMNSAGAQFTNQNAMVSNGELLFTAEKEHSDNKYGAQIKVNANTSPSSSGNKNTATQLFLYMENKDGRVEAGATDGVSEAMAISSSTIAKGTGGIDGDYSNWVAYTVVDKDNNLLQDQFLSAPTLPYASQNAKKANKLNYYTPTINGFKAGLGYVRDVTVQGTTYEALSFKDIGYENVIELGLSYEHKVNNMSFAVSATGQTGEARDAFNKDAAAKDKQAIPLNRLGAWQVGGKVSYDALTLATSYGDWGKSGTLKTVNSSTKKEANFWTAGLAYDHQDKGGVSLTYMGSQRVGAFSISSMNNDAMNAAKNKFNAVSLGAEYKVMPGLMPYAEVTTFNYKSPIADVKTNKGTVVLGGVKLNF